MGSEGNLTTAGQTGTEKQSSGRTARPAAYLDSKGVHRAIRKNHSVANSVLLRKHGPGEGYGSAGFRSKTQTLLLTVQLES